MISDKEKKKMKQIRIDNISAEEVRRMASSIILEEGIEIRRRRGRKTNLDDIMLFCSNGYISLIGGYDNGRGKRFGLTWIYIRSASRNLKEGDNMGLFMYSKSDDIDNFYKPGNWLSDLAMMYSKCRSSRSRF